jgi:hypothetical protein
MDAKPYLVLDFSDIDATLLPELVKLSREDFNLDSVISAAGELKYMGQIKRILATQFKQPEDEWVRFFVSRVHDGFITQKVREQFLPLVDKAARQFLNEQVNDRLKSALGGPDSYVNVISSTSEAEGTPEAQPGEPVLDVTGEGPVSEIVTTEEELEGFRVVRAIVCSEVPATRVFARDTKSNFGILLDNTNRKPIARLWFNRSKKYLGLFDEHKVETKVQVVSVEDIYNHADHLRKTVSRYLNNSVTAEAPVGPTVTESV